MLKKICVLTATSLLFAASLLAQTVPSAIRGALSLSAGAEGSNFNPDWGCANSSIFSCGINHLWGVAVVFDADHIWRRVGVEGEARWLHWAGPPGVLRDSNYLLGPRYLAYRRRGLEADVKCLMGGSWTTLPYGAGSGSYFTIAPGGTLEYGITKKLVVRGDYEYQIWPSFSGIAGLPNKGLTPNGFSAGVKYRLIN
jgi:hypothetical protein